jgi:hypothetical protein
VIAIELSLNEYCMIPFLFLIASFYAAAIFASEFQLFQERCAVRFFVSVAELLMDFHPDETMICLCLLIPVVSLAAAGVVDVVVAAALSSAWCTYRHRSWNYLVALRERRGPHRLSWLSSASCD